MQDYLSLLKLFQVQEYVCPLEGDSFYPLKYPSPLHISASSLLFKACQAVPRYDIITEKR